MTRLLRKVVTLLCLVPVYAKTLALSHGTGPCLTRQALAPWPAASPAPKTVPLGLMVSLTLRGATVALHLLGCSVIEPSPYLRVSPRPPTSRSLLGCSPPRSPPSPRPLVPKSTESPCRYRTPSAGRHRQQNSWSSDRRLCHSHLHEMHEPSPEGICPSAPDPAEHLEFDSTGRQAAMRCMSLRGAHSLVRSIPQVGVARLVVEPLFDYSAAFPSVFHKWIFLVLESVTAPPGLFL